MKRIWMLLALAVATALFVGCGSSSDSTSQESNVSPLGPPGEIIGHGSGTLNCKTYPFIGPGPDDWRRVSYAFGRFGMSHNFAAGSRESDGLLHAKAPMIVEGHKSVVLSVPQAERDRVGIELLKLDRPLSTLTLKPCPDRKRTLWAAGLALRDRRPVDLDVRIGARIGRVRIGPPESRR
jgi:hypothetical protein